MEQEWITDRRPMAADGDRDGDVRMKASPDRKGFDVIHWSYVGDAAPWRHTSLWKPPAQPAPTEPDRITALEQRVTGLLRAQDELIAAMAKRLESLEQLFWAHKHEAQPVSIPAEAQP
jgi:hypothetical protein